MTLGLSHQPEGQEPPPRGPRACFGAVMLPLDNLTKNEPMGEEGVAARILLLFIGIPPVSAQRKGVSPEWR